MAHVYQRGKQYWISYYLNGRLIQKSLKTANERIALSKKKQLEYELSIGDLHMASELPLAAILELFCRYLKNIRTFKSYKNDISRLRTVFGSLCESLKPYPNERTGNRIVRDKYAGVHLKVQLLEDITPTLINRFLADRVEQDSWKPKTANLTRQVLHNLFAFAIKHHGFRPRDRRYPNPVTEVERYREPASQIRHLMSDQIQEQLDVLVTHPVIHAMVAVYIYAGLRREEALWLTHEDVDLEERIIRVRAKTIGKESWQPKTKKNRIVPISSDLYSILKKYGSFEGVWYFPSPTGKRWDPDNFSQNLREINVDHNLVWNCLDFRHTFGSHLAQKGESLYKIAELMGNSPEICRRHYAALIPEKMRDTVEFRKENESGVQVDSRVESMLEQILAKLSGPDKDTPARIKLVR